MEVALGSVVSSHQSINNGAYLNIKPSVGDEWVIHNIYVPNGKNVELYWSDGTNESLQDTNDGAWLNYHFHVTASYYLRVKNVSGSSIYIGYDGIQTKAA